MKEHMSLISKRTEKSRHAVVIMDGAGWHQQHVVSSFDNVTIIKLPPYSPELNPIEQVWLWLRQNELANRCFKGYEDIVEQCTRAWNSFKDDTDRVKNLCTRDWIKCHLINVIGIKYCDKHNIYFCHPL